MNKFDIYRREELKEFLYYSCVHDAKIERFDYDADNRLLTLSLFNSIYGKRIMLSFESVYILMSFCGNQFSTNDAVLSLTVEEDFPDISRIVKIGRDCLSNALYFVIQLFSMNELHIVSQCVSIETEESA